MAQKKLTFLCICIGDLQGFVHFSMSIASTSNAETMLRFSTDMKTSGSFYTDNMLGGLQERKPQPDAPLAAAYFPCSSSLLLRDFEPSVTHRLGQVLTLALSQPMVCLLLLLKTLGILLLGNLTSHIYEQGCTGAAGMAAGVQEYGSIELMLHRSHSNDDLRGLGEGSDDVSVAKVFFFSIDENAGPSVSAF